MKPVFLNSFLLDEDDVRWDRLETGSEMLGALVCIELHQIADIFLENIREADALILKPTRLAPTERCNKTHDLLDITLKGPTRADQSSLVSVEHRGISEYVDPELANRTDPNPTQRRMGRR
ncbi:hypothetical protein DV736_g2951, partial [Chaetothyriales sp. CBS 134916]